MRVYTKEIFLPTGKLELNGSVNALRLESIRAQPIRFVITETFPAGHNCEVDFLDPAGSGYDLALGSIFNFRQREYEHTDKFTTVLLIPTGIGAELGGHCGDGNAVARLMASSCDALITHPNVVNASDINTLPENGLYVEGSIITRLLMGQLGLQKVRSNRVLMLADKHPDNFFNNEIVNAVSSARVTLGLDCDVVHMENIMEMASLYAKSGRAIGTVNHLERLFKIIDKYKAQYDAVGLSTFIQVPEHFHKEYFNDENDMVNPWGGIEAMLTHSIAEVYQIPCAHAPMMASREVMELEVGIVEPRKAPESSSITYLHCILRGLYRSPRIVNHKFGLSVEDISCLVIPYGCVGLPTLACLEQGIPVIAVKENKNLMKNTLEDLPFKDGKLFVVNTYIEAAGVIQALKAGVTTQSVRRPICYTRVTTEVK